LSQPRGRDNTGRSTCTCLRRSPSNALCSRISYIDAAHHDVWIVPNVSARAALRVLPSSPSAPPGHEPLLRLQGLDGTSPKGDYRRPGIERPAGCGAPVFVRVQENNSRQGTDAILYCYVFTCEGGVCRGRGEREAPKLRMQRAPAAACGCVSCHTHSLSSLICLYTYSNAAHLPPAL
jgi:hypothetical protein